ncbi:MAG: DnaJ domain-containing protein, partial [Thermoproteota archaeon]|nr:DnaJ domain-containing protein [Thermoproteota archaeon]
MGDYLDSNDYYKTLGILKQASNIEVKIAYRRLARKYHPDRNSDVSDDVMKNINIAFEVLSDPDKRKEYDEKIIDRVLENSDKMDNRYANNNVNRGN